MATILTDIVKNCNYVEFVLVPRLVMEELQPDGTVSTIDANLDNNTFYALLSQFKNNTNNAKYMQRFFKRLIYRNMFYETNEKYEIKTYKQTISSIVKLKGPFVVTGYNKQKISFHSFPSTSENNMECYVNSIVFKVNNRLFLNFDIISNNDTDKKFYKIYMNYNHEHNVDVDYMETQIKSMIQTFFSSVCKG